MPPIDPARLLFQLQNTGLQNKDNPLYQLLSQMIGVITGLNSSVSGLSGSSAANIINNILGFPPLSDGGGGGDGEIGPPGIPGRDGISGTQGRSGLDGEDGLSPDIIPGPMGPAGPMVPTFIGINETFCVPYYKQALFNMTIDVEGILDIEGYLIQITDDCCLNPQPKMQLIEESYYEESPRGPSAYPYDTIVANATNGTINDLAIGEGDVLLLSNNTADVTITGIAGGKQGQRVTVYNNGTNPVFLSNANAGSVAQNRLRNWITIGDTPLGLRGSATYEWSSTDSVWILISHNQGAAIDVAFAAGNFTANGIMTWTVAAGDVSFNRYYVIGKNLYWTFRVVTTTVAGTPNTLLQVTAPNSFQFSNFDLLAYTLDNGVFTLATLSGSATLMVFAKTAGGNWTAAVDNTRIGGAFLLPLV